MSENGEVNMLKKLFDMVKCAKKGMCIQAEYYHVVGCVIKIWKSPAYIELGEKPLIHVQADTSIAPVEALIMLNAYLSLTEKEQSKIKTLSIDIIDDKQESIYD